MGIELLTTDIKIPSPNLEFLRKNFSNCFTKEGKFDFEKFKQELSQSDDIDFSNEGYSMGWLGKSYSRLLASDKATTLLKEDKEWNHKPENQTSENLLLKGDNLEVLKHLSNAYHEQIKMIYIDPPYNTGSDGFVYQDDRKFTVEELSKLAAIDAKEAKRILEFTQSKSNSHSAWLTFMYPRLFIAHKLLKDDGVIFISIDDNEVAQLRILMDEIFGEQNFVGEFAWRKTDNQSNIGDLARVKEYVVSYRKSGYSFELNKMNLSEKAKKEYRYDEGKGKFRRSPLYHKTRASNHYDITLSDGSVHPGPWMIKQEELLRRDGEGEIYWTTGGDRLPYGKTYLADSKGQISSDWLGIEYGTNQRGSLEVEQLFNERIFDFPKPTSLVKHFLKIGSNQGDTILDFFAGSGTTGDALMQLNSEDGSSRKYILVQLPETINPKKNQTAYTYVKDTLKVNEPTIFDITKERLVRAGKKIKKENKTSKEPKDISKVDFGFKIFETVPIWEDFDLEAIAFDSQTKIFNENILSGDDLKTLLATWKTADGIPLTRSLNEIDLDGYSGHYFDKRLYLIDKGFKTKNLTKLLEEVDSNKDFTPAKIIVFGYNFESKMLREIADNVKQYSNKKNIDVEFITRY